MKIKEFEANVNEIVEKIQNLTYDFESLKIKNRPVNAEVKAYINVLADVAENFTNSVDNLLDAIDADKGL